MTQARTSQTTSIERRLRLYVRVADVLVTIGMFVFIIRYKLDVGSYFPSVWDVPTLKSWRSFLPDKGIAALFSLTTVYTFLTWRFHARKELDIGTQLFSRSRIPQEWTRIEGHRLVPPLIIAFYLLFLILAYSVDDMKIFAPTMAAIYMIALTSQWLRMRNLKRYFADPNFLPPATDDHREFIMRRREVAENYLFGGAHVIKEAAIVCCCIGAAFAAYAGDLFGIQVWYGLPNVILISTILVFEAITFAWRRDRDKRLDEIDIAQEYADRLRVQESGTLA